MEEKQENFERIAERRVQEVIKKIQLIGNLSNRGNYSYTEELVNQIFDAIETELQAVREKFNPVDASNQSKFTFSRDA